MTNFTLFTDGDIKESKKQALALLAENFGINPADYRVEHVFYSPGTGSVDTWQLKATHKSGSYFHFGHAKVNDNGCLEYAGLTHHISNERESPVDKAKEKLTGANISATLYALSQYLIDTHEKLHSAARDIDDTLTRGAFSHRSMGVAHAGHVLQRLSEYIFAVTALYTDASYRSEKANGVLTSAKALENES